MEKEFLYEISTSIFMAVFSLYIAFAKTKRENFRHAWAYYLNWVAKIAIPFWIIVCYGIPVVKDLPYIVSGDYCYVDGMVLEKNKRAATVEIEDRKTGEIVEVSVKNARVSVGNWRTVKYLPNEKIGIVVDEIEEKSESRRKEEKEMEKIALMEGLLAVLIIATFVLERKKKKWMVYFEIGLYKRMMLMIGAIMVGIIVMCSRSSKVPVKWSAYMTVLAVLMFLSGILIQHMGIKRKENTLIVVPIVGKKREIPEQKINQFVSDRTDMIEIMDGEKAILRVSDQFHGYEELKDILRKNTGEI